MGAGLGWQYLQVVSRRDAHQVVKDYWAAANSKDWDAFVGLVAPDVLYEAPQTRERVRGRDAYRRYNAEGFPGDWHLEIVRVIAEETSAVSWISMTDEDEVYPGLCFFELDDDGLIARITDFWPASSPVPASRAHLAETY